MPREPRAPDEDHHDGFTGPHLACVARSVSKKEAAAIREIQRRLKEESSVEEMKALHDTHAEKTTGVKRAQRLDWM